jgi:murein DD-endopeptidase MepM/ murein hydrolase activator NlpD
VALRTKGSSPVVPVAPLPATPALGPGSLVHLERILPLQGLTPAPVGVVSATRTISSAWGPRMRTQVVRVRVRASRRDRRIIRRFLGTHKGVDLSAPMGTDIFAAMDGEVVASGRQKQYGNFVAIDHGNGVVTLYAHCNRNFVEAGDIVRRGQKIAEVGRTGNATGPHLHFELRLDGIPQNPLPKMNDMEEIPAEMVARNQGALPPAGQR